MEGSMPAKKESAAKRTTKASAARAGAKLAVAAADAKLATAANKKRAEALLDLIARRAERIAEDFYEIGKALKELLQKRLYVALGYASFAAMLEARGVLSETQARKLIEVVSRVPLATALKLGPEKAFAMVKYTDATPEPDTPELLLQGGAMIGGKAAAEASKRDIEEATKKLRRSGAAKRGKLEPAQREAEQVAKRGGGWLKTRGAKKARIEARRTTKGHVVVITLAVADAAALFET
jgi:hypothetical protein